MTNEIYTDIIQSLKEKGFDRGELSSLAVKGQWVEYNGNPVLTTGNPGEWDAGALGS